MKKKMKITACIGLAALAACLGACGKKEPPLDSQLKAIECPADEKGHATATFVKAKITFVCLSKELAGSPFLLRCDRTSRPMICEDTGNLYFSRAADGTVYGGLLPEEQKRKEVLNPANTSRLVVHFHSGAPRQSTFDAVETNWNMVLPDGKELLPRTFTFVKGTLCDRAATVLGHGSCILEAESASLYWHISVEVNAPKGTPISEETYREELTFWLKLLDKVVKDPAT